MWQTIMRTKTRMAVLTVLAAIAVGVAVAWIVAFATQPATSEEPNPAAIIPTGPPLTPYIVIPTALASPLSEEERSLEPPPGALPTVSPEEQPIALTSTRNVPEGWVVYDNPKFRYTFALPPDWSIGMEPEGGQFSVSDPVALANNRALAESPKAELQPGGVGMNFVGRVGRAVDSSSLAHVAEPNTSFGEYPGAIWEELSEADRDFGIAETVHFAFRRGDILFYGDAKLSEGYSDSDIATVYQIINTITPY
jgi:hypothetical protein